MGRSSCSSLPSSRRSSDTVAMDIDTSYRLDQASAEDTIGTKKQAARNRIQCSADYNAIPVSAKSPEFWASTSPKGRKSKRKTGSKTEWSTFYTWPLLVCRELTPWMQCSNSKNYWTLKIDSVRLCDAALFFVILALRDIDAHSRFTFDLKGNNSVRDLRPSCSPCVVIEAFGVFWFPSYRGYLFCGDYWRAMGWTIGDRVLRTENIITVGDVVAPPEAVQEAKEHGLFFKMLAGSTWYMGSDVEPFETKPANQYSQDFILALIKTHSKHIEFVPRLSEDVWVIRDRFSVGLQKQVLVEGFSHLASAEADPKNRYQALPLSEFEAAKAKARYGREYCPVLDKVSESFLVDWMHPDYDMGDWKPHFHRPRLEEAHSLSGCIPGTSSMIEGPLMPFSQLLTPGMEAEFVPSPSVTISDPGQDSPQLFPSVLDPLVFSSHTSRCPTPMSLCTAQNASEVPVSSPALDSSTSPSHDVSVSRVSTLLEATSYLHQRLEAIEDPRNPQCLQNDHYEQCVHNLGVDGRIPDIIFPVGLQKMRSLAASAQASPVYQAGDLNTIKSMTLIEKRLTSLVSQITPDHRDTLRLALQSEERQRQLMALLSLDPAIWENESRLTDLLQDIRQFNKCRAILKRALDLTSSAEQRCRLANLLGFIYHIEDHVQDADRSGGLVASSYGGPGKADEQYPEPQ